MKKIFVCILSGVLTVACGYDRFGTLGPGDLEGSGTLPDADLALLREHFYGDPFVVQEDLTVGGYVVSDDRAGNFFRSFIIDDGSGAVEIRAGFYDLHAYCQRGRRIVIHARGLAVGMYNGVVQLGAGVNDWSAYRVEEFGSRVLLDRCMERDTLFREVPPLEPGIGGLEERYCGRPDSGGLPLGRTGDVGGCGGRVGDAGHGNGLVPGCCRGFGGGRDERLRFVRRGYRSGRAGDPDGNIDVWKIRRDARGLRPEVEGRE